MDRLGASKFWLHHPVAIPWPRCPACDRPVSPSAAKVTLARLPEVETAIRNNEAPDWDDEGHYIARLDCEHCRTAIFAAGHWSSDVDYEPDKDGEMSQTTKRYFTPQWFSHYPRLVRAPPRAPKEIREALDRADALFWRDLNACATALRQVVDVFLDTQGVPRRRQERRPGQPPFLSLEARIALFVSSSAAASPDHSKQYEDLLRAAKFIGNDGTHGKAMTEKHIALTASFIGRVLALRYPERDETLAKAKRIAARHPPHRAKRQT